jgi:hypothetical protein
MGNDIRVYILFIQFRLKIYLGSVKTQKNPNQSCKGGQKNRPTQFLGAHFYFFVHQLVRTCTIFQRNFFVLLKLETSFARSLAM